MTICQKIFIAEYGAHGGCGKILHRTSVFSYEFYGGAHGGCGIIYYRTPRPILFALFFVRTVISFGTFLGLMSRAAKFVEMFCFFNFYGNHGFVAACF